MELNQMRYFLAVAETLNFTRAAEKVGISQPSLTRAIQKLEEELGGPLFRRERRKTHLTELGRTVLPRFQQALLLTDMARTEAEDYAKMAAGTLTLGVMCTIAPEKLISLIKHLNANVPNLKIQLREAAGDKVLSMLQDGAVDAAILALPHLPDTLETAPLYEEPFVVAFHRGHPFEAMEEIPLAALDGQKYLRRLNCEYLDEHAQKARDLNLKFDLRMESDHESWIQAMVIAELGATILPASLARSPEVLSRPMINPSSRRQVTLATMRGRRHTPLVELFSRYCRSLDWQ